MPAANLLPLRGIKVLDLSRVLAGPYCCSMLGELGAEVIKVERPGKGDENRGWGKLWEGNSLDFMNVNRNKRDITINFSQPQGRQIARQLAGQADVLVESFTPGTLDKFELGWEHLRPLNPKLIYCSISAFGARGPMRNEPGYDGTIQAFSGLMHITGEEEGGPVRSGASFVDMGTGITAYSAVLTALLGRQLNGEGQKVEVSLLQTAIAFLGTHAAVYKMTGHQPTRAGSGVSHLAPYGAFRTRDSHVVTGALNQETWIKLCHVLGCSPLTEDARFVSLNDRVRNRPALNRLLEASFQEKTTKDWVRIFNEAGLVIAPVKTLAEAIDDPQVVENRMITEVEHAQGRLILAALPMTFSQWETKPRLPPPGLGEHTDEILTELGYSVSDIHALREAGAI